MTWRLLALLVGVVAFGASDASSLPSAPPAITIDVPSSVPTADPSGIDVTYSVKSHLDPAANVTCTPAGGPAPQFTVTAHFAVGQTTISCTDDANPQNTASATVTVTFLGPPPADTTAPTLTVPGDITTQATSATGAVVTFSATATDDTDPNPTVSCNPASGSLFPIGTTTVTCTATDASNNSVQKTFTVTVQEAPPPPPPPPPPGDTTGPVFSGVPGTLTVQANGPAGSVVTYTPPSAADAIDGPAVVSCSPAPGALFPLGSTTVTCSAADNHGNSSSTSFLVRVVDTTPPTLIVPPDSSAYADSPESLSVQGYGLAQFLASANAFDLVDPHPSVSNNAGERLTVGVHVVTFTASDASGNSVSRNVTFEVLPMPPPGTPPRPLPTAAQPPANVTNFRAIAGDGQVRLTWQLPRVVDHVVMTRALTAGGDPQTVYAGKGTSFTDRGVANGLEYRYLIVTVDAAGNQSTGAVATASPRRNLLRSPKDGARLKKPPKLTWVRNSEAEYYNVQLFRGKDKILSIWPVKPSVALKRSWKYGGKRYTLSRGVYRWYVWPGFGPRSAVDYGELLGSRNFQITR